MIYWLALDIGTTGTKAALMNEHGEILRSAVYDYPTYNATNGVMEQDAADWWRAVTALCHEIAADTQVDAIALTGQMQDVILVDSDANPLRPVILYSDTRARAEAETVLNIIGAKQLHKLTGYPQDAGGLLAKLLWLRHHEEHHFQQSNLALLIGGADFIALKMTGLAVTDTTNAATTGLMNLASRQWLDAKIFKNLGIASVIDWLPSLQPGGGYVGQLTDHAAAELRLSPGIPVFHGPGDAGATTLGAGAGELGRVYGYLGTSGWVAFTSEAQTGNAWPLAHPAENRFIQVAPLMTAGGNLAWIRDLFEASDFGQLITEALAQPPTDLLYLPYLNGERSPFSDPFARGAFVGLGLNTNRADMVRAVLEGVVFAYRHALDVLVPTRISDLTLTGGGTRSIQWAQLFADILNVPVGVAAEAEFIGVRGAVLAAQVASGQRASYTNEPPLQATLSPNQDNRDHFERQYRRFRDLYPALKPIFAPQ